MDYAQGELEYNTFITDVGALGVMFSHQFHYAIPHLPILAPFFDMLTTHKLRQPFTAAEALAFFEDFYGDLSEEELEKELPWLDGAFVPYRHYYESDRWASVSPDLAEKWVKYREPPASWKTKLLRRLFQYDWLHYPKVMLVRQFLARILKLLRAVYSSFHVSDKAK
ncbi:hypothetical protein D9613_007166 [Agrocybe pediades]|uniref:Uncharacterized protein n=1 Tax=Agrocybe pediades TaxID=84607 RepID=A0A8H4VHN0_9AGAR|nr:hypothetical protein D9613_007166 [Agrocybe pediades]